MNQDWSVVVGRAVPGALAADVPLPAQIAHAEAALLVMGWGLTGPGTSYGAWHLLLLLSRVSHVQLCATP